MRTTIILFFLLISITLTAQPPDKCNKHEEQIQAQKVAFLTKNLDLTVQEAQQFWPVYNEYEKKKDALFNDEKNLLRSMINNDKLSDKEMDDLVNKYVDLQQTEAKLAQEYNIKFKKVLPIKKVMMLYASDHMFKRELLKQLRNCPMPKEK